MDLTIDSIVCAFFWENYQELKVLGMKSIFQSLLKLKNS